MAGCCAARCVHWHSQLHLVLNGRLLRRSLCSLALAVTRAATNTLGFNRAAADTLSPPCINFIFGAFHANKKNQIRRKFI
jgi:hypothetical protein